MSTLLLAEQLLALIEEYPRTTADAELLALAPPEALRRCLRHLQRSGLIVPLSVPGQKGKLWMRAA